MGCKFKSELVHFIYDEVTAEEKQNIKDHLNVCSECSEEVELLRTTKETLYEWKDIIPSPDYRELLDDKLKTCAHEEVSMKENIKEAIFSMIKTLSPGICGILVTTIMVIIMSADVSFRNLNPLSLMICGVFWSGIYSMIFDLAIKNGSHGKIRMRRLLKLNLKSSVYVTFIALAAGLALTILSPFQAINNLYLEPFLYSFLPLLISALLLSRRVKHNYTIHSVFMAIFYILLMGPALYMKCLDTGFLQYLLCIASSSTGAMAGGITGALIVSRMFIFKEKSC